MASTKKQVQLNVSTDEHSPSSDFQARQAYNSIGGISRLARAEVSPERYSIWRDSEFISFRDRGERVIEPPSTSTAPPIRGYNKAQRRGQQTSGSQGASSSRKGPSNLTRFPDIHRGAKPSASTPSSPGCLRGSQPGSPSIPRVSANGMGAGFAAGATVASVGAAKQQQQLTAAATMFAMAGGSTLAAASIVYNQAVARPSLDGGSPLRGAGMSGSLPDPQAPVQPGSVAGDIGLAGSGPGGSGSGEQEGAVTLQDDVLGDNERLRARLVSLPNIVCRSANGDVYLVDLANVQAMLNKREHGGAVDSHVGRATPSVFSDAGGSPPHATRRHRRHPHRAPGEAGAEEGPAHGTAAGGAGQVSSRSNSPQMTRSTSRGRSANASINGRSVTGHSMGIGSGSGADPVLEEELRQHVAATEAAVEARRKQLAAEWRARRSTNPAASSGSKEEEEAKRAAAIDYAINQFFPTKLALMALNMHVPKSELATATKLEEEPGVAFGAGFKQGKLIGKNWNRLQAGIDRLYERLPFITAWSAAIDKMRREETAGWDSLLSGDNDMYVKGRGEHQGTNIYVLKCQELGVTPSTQVVQQLASPSANMSHCKLDRQGAAALRHALSANVTITHLNLQDNNLDAVAVGQIIEGIYNGTLAKQPNARKVMEKRSASLHAHSSRAMAAQPSRRGPVGELQVNLIPPHLAREQAARQQQEAAERLEAVRAAEQEAAAETAAAAARSGAKDEPDWLRAINSGSARFTSEDPSRRGTRTPDLPARMPHPSVGALSPGRLTCSITSLDLSNNPIGINGVRALAELLDPAVTHYQFLKHLFLAKCGIPEAGGLLLAGALSHGNTALAVLDLSNNSLGSKTAALLGELLGTASGLQELDLSWNQIRPDGVRALAAGLALNSTLRRLNLSWNGLESAGVGALGPMLASNDWLVYLDLTNTRMGSEAALLLADGIRANHTLEVLILNGNAVGDDGARALMAALKANTSLQYLGLQGTNMSAATRGRGGAADFNPLSPDGSYCLDLSCAADRSVALQLCELDAAAPADLLKNIRLADRNVSSVKAMHWPASLPVSGVLTCDFVSRRSAKALAVMDAKKFTALASQFGSGTMSDKEKLMLVEVMSPFHFLHCEQAAALLRTFSIGDEAVAAAALLFARAADLDDNIGLLTEALQADACQDSLHDVLGWYSYTRWSNPTGHYELNLTSRIHQALAARLKDTAYSEPPEALNWINIIYDTYTDVTKVASNYGPPEAWKGQVPSSGTLAFDFVSSVVAPPGATPVGDTLLNEVLVQDLGIPLDAAGCPVAETQHAAASEQVARLRPIVARMVFSAGQVSRLASAFAAPPHRVEVLVTCYAALAERARDLWTVMYGLGPLEQALAGWRLGPGSVFSKEHPTGHYILDLANKDHEAVARRLVDLALAHPELPNFWNLRINGVRRALSENRNLWGTFTSDIASPFMEFDFIGPDGFEVAGRSKADIDAMGPGDRLDLRTRQARRMELSRLQALYAYYEDGSGWQRPEWQSRELLMRPLLDKAPWQAAWDRMARLLIRYELRSGDIEGDSPLEDVFFTATAGEDAMTAEQWEALLRDWGFSRMEISYMREAFDAAGREATPADGPAFKPVAPAARQLAAVSGSGAATGSASSTGDGTAPTSTKEQGTASKPGHVVPPLPGHALRSQTSARQAAAPGVLEAGAGGEQRAGTGDGDGGDDVAGGAPVPAKPMPNTVVDFPIFVRLFMKEPPRALRFLHAAGAATAAAGAATSTAKTRRTARR